MPDEMEAAICVAARRRDIRRVLDQPVEVKVHRVGRVRSCGRRIAALARRNGAVSGLRERHDLPVPSVEGFGKTVQQQHERAIFRSVDQRVEHKSRRGRDLAQLRHGHADA